jgi:uncharacterized lipoprotein YddW (UPF0748 family)
MSFTCTAASMLVAFAAGCTHDGGVRRDGMVRAMWVTRWDYRTPEDVRTIVRNCESVKVNAIIFQVRGNGTVFYPSAIEPWAEEFDFGDPGFDPLATAVEEAHRRNIQLHAWVNVMPAWRGTEPPECPEQLYNKHPEWLLYDQNGNRQPLTEHYVIVNPCLPEVRGYLVRLFEEICRNYAVDGLHMDYIRFVTHGSAEGADYPYDARTLKLFKEKTGSTPADAPEAWDDFRREAVNRLVADIHRMMRRVRPSAELSASVFGRRDFVRENLFQDGGAWLKKGDVDLVFPMVYTGSMDDYTNWVEDWRSVSAGHPVVPGIGLYKHEDNETSVQQLRQAGEWGDGYCIFAYSSLFASAPRSQESGSGERARGAESRRKRLEALTPVLLELADGSTVQMASAGPAVR